MLPAADPELLEEIALHLAETWARVQASEGAVEADRRAFQDLDAWRHRRTARAARPGVWAAATRGLALDTAGALRSILTRPVASAGAALLVAVAISATSAVVAVTYGVLGRPLPYPEAKRIVTVWQSFQGHVNQISYPDYLDLQRTGMFEMSGAMMSGVGTFLLNGRADRLNAIDAEPAVLSILGAMPIRGRLLTADDSGKPFVMISHRLWQSAFGGREDVIGAQFALSGTQLTVVGVLPPGFDLEFPVTSTFGVGRNDIWAPFDRASSLLSRRDVTTYEVIARLAPGVDEARAQAMADATAVRLQQSFAETNGDRGLQLIGLRSRATEAARRPLLLACVASAMVLMLALANLTTLSLGRLSARAAELALRRSLGATTWRLARQLIVENAFVTAAGAAAGMGAGVWLCHAMTASRTARLPRPDAIQFDSAVWAVVVGLSAALALIPALVALHLAPSAASSPSGNRVVGPAAGQWRRALVVTEVAIALVMSVSAALLSLTTVRLLNVDAGFATAGTLTLRVSAYAGRYPDKAATSAFFTSLARDLGTLPGVALASFGSSLPLSGQATGTNLMAAETPLPPSARLNVGWQTVAPGYFAAAGIPVLRGRDVMAADASRPAHLTVLNQSAARALFGDADPVGRRVAVGGGDADGDWHEVIAVVGDVRHTALADAPMPRVYDVFGQHWGRTIYLVIQSRPGVTAASLESAVRRTIAAADPSAPIFEMATVETLVAKSVATRRLAAVLAAGLAGVSILLALIGTFAIVACLVAERTSEMGVRLALGAPRFAILRLILTEAVLTSLGGCLIGSAGAALAARVLQEQLFGVRAADAAWLTAVLAVGLAVGSLIAGWWPARRATLADPLAAMRQR